MSVLAYHAAIQYTYREFSMPPNKYYFLVPRRKTQAAIDTKFGLLQFTVRFVLGPPSAGLQQKCGTEL